MDIIKYNKAKSVQAGDGRQSNDVCETATDWSMGNMVPPDAIISESLEAAKAYGVETEGLLDAVFVGNMGRSYDTDVLPNPHNKRGPGTAPETIAHAGEWDGKQLWQSYEDDPPISSASGAASMGSQPTGRNLHVAPQAPSTVVGRGSLSQPKFGSGPTRGGSTGLQTAVNRPSPSTGASIKPGEGSVAFPTPPSAQWNGDSAPQVGTSGYNG